MPSRKLSPISIFTAALALSGLATTAFAQSSYDTALKNLRFRSIGPAVMGGRTDDIAVVESDPRIIYIGGRVEHRARASLATEARRRRGAQAWEAAGWSCAWLRARAPRQG